MERFDRIYELHDILKTSRYPVSRKQLEEKLECSRNTIGRLIGDLKNFYGAPIDYDRKRNGYYYTEDGASYELPGLWFNESELYALLTAQQLFNNIEPGLLQSKIKPLTDRIEKLLQLDESAAIEISKRVYIHLQSYRTNDSDIFQKIAFNLINRNKINITYDARTSAVQTVRDISPQRLTHYRDNWYLDAWCHTRHALRSFSLDKISNIKSLNENAEEINEQALSKHFSSSYGIFSGEEKHKAIIRFSQTQARWIADEQWHPKQKSIWLADGRYQLEIPYHDPQELIMDILKYGPEAEVIAPENLRLQVIQKLEKSLEKYKVSENCTTY